MTGNTVTEDLYTGRVTIRQIRASRYDKFPMKDVWEMITRMGGPGIKTEGGYLICPSAAFCNALLQILSSRAININPMEWHEVLEGAHEYCRKYPLTILIQD